MLNFFDTVIGYIEMFVGLAVNLVKSLGMMVVVLVKAVILPQSFIFYVPSFLAVSITIVVAVSVLKLLIGRDNG